MAVFEAVAKAPVETLAHALRWYTHIASLNRASLPGDKKDASAYGPEVVAAPAAADDDDIDLFGSDEEEDAEAERVKAQRLAEYHAKKSASKSFRRSLLLEHSSSLAKAAPGSSFHKKTGAGLELRSCWSCAPQGFALNNPDTHRTQGDCKIHGHSGCQTLGRRDRHEGLDGRCPRD